MQPTMNDWQRLDELLERGLDYYGRQLVAEAIECWREVLFLSPGHRLALEYLDAAGASPEPGQPGDATERGDAAASPRPGKPSVGRASTKDDRSSGRRDERARASTADEQPLSLESLSTLTVELIRERKFEEALALLYTAHGEAPRDPSISRSISVVKQRLLKEYRTELGDPSQVPALAYDEALIEELPLSEDERELVPLIDGIVALEDVLQSCGLGALQAHRALAQLIRRRVIVLGRPADPKKGSAPDRTDRAAPPDFAPRPASPPAPEARPAPTLKLVPPPAPEPTPVAHEAVGPEIAAPTNELPAALPDASPSGAVHLPVSEVRSKTLPISILPPRIESRPAPESPSPPASPTAELPKPSRYAAHVAEAVRAHLQGHAARAKELLQLCIQECPDEPTARRTLERLKQRLAAGNSDRKDQR